MLGQRRRPRLRMFLASHPRLANRLFGMLGWRGVERAGRRAAIRTARYAYNHVPYYRTLYEAHGFDARRMRHLTWDDFLQLPSVGKAETDGVPDADLLDATIGLPEGDSLIARSSGTTREPVVWPAGWDEFFTLYSFFENALRNLGAAHSKTAVLLAFPVDGGSLAGNLMLRAIFLLKETTRWPFEVVAVGEVAESTIWYLRWFARQGFDALYLIFPPGTMERLLDRLDALQAEGDGAPVVDWSRFARKHIVMGGQLVSRELRERVQQAMSLDPRRLEDIEILLASSDTAQIFGRSTAFTQWLERYCEAHPELTAQLGIPEGQEAKALLEFVPPMSIYIEQDPSAGLLLTTAKHHPLVRYRSNDLAWLRHGHDVVRILNKHAKGWREDFKSYGYGNGDIPHLAMLGMILGRADDLVLVNAALVTPDILRDALRAAGVLPQIHHFKHSANADRPNEYDVYLELPDEQNALARDLLAAQWEPGLLEALTSHPAAADLQAAHRANPIQLKVFVRSRGTEEFEGDDQKLKVSYTVRRPAAPRQDVAPAAVASQPESTEAVD